MKNLILLFFLSTSAYAKICIWKPFKNSPNLLVPAPANDCKSAVQKYVDAVNADGDLRSMMGGRTLPIPTSSSYKDFKVQKNATRPLFAILANEFEQISDPTEFVITNTAGKLKKLGADIFVLPVAADMALGTLEADQFRAVIAETFDALLAQGGEDINPALYQQKITTAMAADIHPTRDQHEALFQASYIARAKGVFYAICRGHQLASVTQGQHLYQDIYTADQYTSAHTSTRHGGGAWHPITLNSNSIFIKWAFTEKINGQSVMWVNSFHHEAVAYPLTANSKNLVVTGFEQDDANNESHKIIEVLESTDGKYITMQFHPEGMDDDQHDNGTKILKGMVQHALAMRTQ